MESSRVIIATFAVLLFFEAAAGDPCSWDEYEEGGQCKTCPSCPPGQEITENCGQKNCQSCIAGRTFSDKNSTEGCRNCLACELRDKIEIKKCTPTSNTVCGCPNGTYESKWGDCVKTPKTTIQLKKTTSTVTPRRTKTTLLPGTPKISTTKPLSPLNETGKQGTHLKAPRNSSHNPFKAIDKSFNTFRKPGWIVLFCLMAVCLGLLAVAGIHSHTRKQISRRCCGVYGELRTDADTTSVLVEGHHEESVTVEPINNATPIPFTEEATPLSLRSHSTTDLCYRNGTDEAMDGQMECTCAMKTSETSLRSLDKLAFTSLPAETIVNDCQDRLSSSSCSALRSENDWIVSHSCPNCRTPSPLCGRSTDHHCTASFVTSTCVTRSLPHTPENSRVTSPSNSCSTTGLPSSDRSPEHRRITPSSWSACISNASSSSSGISPDPSNFSSFHSHSNFGEDHEVFSESGEYNPSSQMQSIPISVEAVDHAGPSKAMAKNTHLVPKKATKGKPVEERENLSTEGDVTSYRDCELQLTEISARKETRNDKEKKMTQKPTDEELSDSSAMTSIGNATRIIAAEKIKSAVPRTNNYVTPRSHCKYRPIQRHEEHRCSECCPQPEDSFFQLINKERLCLKEQICKELSRSYKDLAISARVENKTAEWETSSNPAERVLDAIKASHPKMKLKEFDELLLQMKRLDIVELIQNHHLFCSLCERNRFDSRA